MQCFVFLSGWGMHVNSATKKSEKAHSLAKLIRRELRRRGTGGFMDSDDEF